MDPAGISVTALSINDARPELFGKDGPAIARLLNDFIAEVSKNPPSRFIGLAVLPLQNMNAATSELDRCVTSWGRRDSALFEPRRKIFGSSRVSRSVRSRGKARAIRSAASDLSGHLREDKAIRND